MYGKFAGREIGVSLHLPSLSLSPLCGRVQMEYQRETGERGVVRLHLAYFCASLTHMWMEMDMETDGKKEKEKKEKKETRKRRDKESDQYLIQSHSLPKMINCINDFMSKRHIDSGEHENKLE